jgi:hypothetical protein
VRPIVIQRFRAFTKSHEAEVNRLYNDSKSLPTYGLGQLVREPEDTLPIPWRRPDGSLATPEEKLADWHRVKTFPNAAALGRHIPVGPTTLFVSPEDLTRLFEAKRDHNARKLKERFPGLPAWPAPAQFAVMSLAWAAGTGFDFPKCAAALQRGDFLTAAVEVLINEVRTKGVKRRNDANRWLLLDAHAGGDPDHLDLVERPRAEVNARLAAALAASHGPPVVIIHDEAAPDTTPPATERQVPDLEDLRGVQQALASLGYDPGPLDGIRGARTRGAVVAFQRAQGLTPDGIVGPRTREALAKALAAGHRVR